MKSETQEFWKRHAETAAMGLLVLPISAALCLLAGLALLLAYLTLGPLVMLVAALTVLYGPFVVFGIAVAGVFFMARRRGWPLGRAGGAAASGAGFMLGGYYLIAAFLLPDFSYIAEERERASQRLAAATIDTLAAIDTFTYALPDSAFLFEHEQMGRQYTAAALQISARAKRPGRYRIWTRMECIGGGAVSDTLAVQLGTEPTPVNFAFGPDDGAMPNALYFMQTTCPRARSADAPGSASACRDSFGSTIEAAVERRANDGPRAGSWETVSGRFRREGADLSCTM